MKSLLFLLFIFCLAISISKSNEYFDECSGIMFGFYHDCLSPLKTPVSQCQFNPSCSEYSSIAIKEFGITKGLLMTTDRLIRCSGGHASSNDYPYQKQKFIDRPKNHSLFGDGKLWSLGITDSYSDIKIETDTIFSFALSLFESGELQLSQFELLHISFNNRDSIVIAKTNLLLGVNEFLTSKSIKTLDYLSEMDKIENKHIKFNYFILKYLISDLQNLNTYSINLCKQYSDTFSSDILQRLMVYSYYKNFELENAIDKINNINVNYKDVGFDTIPKYMTENFDKNIKSPALAGILSAIIPGTGYIYSGRLKEGVSALLINGLLGVGIYSLFDSGNVGSGILTSMICFPFYLGNIIGSANAAETVNIKQQQIVLSNLRNSLGISFYFSTEQIAKFWE